MKRIHAETLPQMTVKLILGSIHGVKFHKYGNGLAGNVPAADTNFQPFGQKGRLTPFLQHCLRLGEIKSGALVCPDIRPDEYHPVFI